MKRFWLLLALSSICISAQATDILSLNRGWRFCKGTELRQITDGEAVDLPHTWNASDAMFGNKEYYRGMGTYLHELIIDEKYEGKRIFLRVNAAQTIADIFIDNHFVFQHKGGYTAFTVELTPFITVGKSHKLHIRVNNSHTTEVAPLSGDFNIYGGLYRGVDLLIADKTCIDPTFHASSGVFFSQTAITKDKAEVQVEALISNPQNNYEGCDVVFQIWDSGKMIEECVSDKINEEGKVQGSLVVENPHLWNGMNDPYLYQGVVILRKDGTEVDRREENIGFRYYHADPEKGFFLNGSHYPLRGANLHQDRAERASAYYDCDYDEDIALMEEMGCNAVRLVHYQHAKKMHECTDKKGMIVWAEMPFVNIYINNPAYADNLRQQLKELIYQNYNHPSIFFWGLFNEINSYWMENVDSMAKELNEMAHRLDRTRPTVGATNQSDAFNGYPDYIAHNKYFGWYGNSPREMSAWVDKEHETYPDRKLGISEYGAGGCVFQQSELLEHPEPWGQWHPENWQTYYHIENWKILKERDYLWCTFVWCMFDLSAAGRREGNVFGRNDKGLVTYDRKIKKDAFYFYKANWNKEDKFLYISERRNTERHNPVTDIKVFGNCGEAELFVNGKSAGRKKPDEVNVIVWKDINLDKGKNVIMVKNRHADDTCEWHLL